MLWTQLLALNIVLKISLNFRTAAAEAAEGGAPAEGEAAPQEGMDTD